MRSFVWRLISLRDHNTAKWQESSPGAAYAELNLVSDLTRRLDGRTQVTEVKHSFQNVAIDVDTRSCKGLCFWRIYLQTSSHSFAYDPVWDRLHSCRLLSQKNNVIGKLEVSDPVTMAKLYSTKVIEGKKYNLVYSVVEQTGHSERPWRTPESRRKSGDSRRRLGCASVGKCASNSRTYFSGIPSPWSMFQNDCSSTKSEAAKESTKWWIAGT